MELLITDQLVLGGDDDLWWRVEGDDEDAAVPVYVDFVSRILGRRTSETGVFPFDVRWVSACGKAAIFEIPPMIQNIVYTNAVAHVAEFGDEKGRRKEHVFHLPIPRAVIGVVLSGNAPSLVYHMICRDPIVDDASPLWLVPMPNVYADGKICAPSSDRRFNQKNFTDGLMSAYEVVWDTRYNADLVEVVKYVAGGNPAILHTKMLEYYRRTSRAKNRALKKPKFTPLQMFRQWQRLTPEEVYNITDWPQHGDVRTFGQLKHRLLMHLSKGDRYFELTVRNALGVL